MQSIQELIQRYAPGVRADDLRLMPHPGWGGDSDAWLVDERWIFRFPRSPEVARRLAIETCLLPRLARRLSVAIPQFSYVARDERGDPIFGGYEAIPGEPLEPELLRSLPQATANRIAKSLGDFLRELHLTPPADAIACGVASPGMTPRELMERDYACLTSTVFPALAVDERAWVEGRFAEILAEPRTCEYTPRVLHGDFSPDHILFDPSRGELSGIIDFGDVTIGDPAGEFTWRADYGEAFFQRVLAAYRIADSDLPHRTTFRIDCLPLIQIEYGLALGQPADVAEGRRRLRERIALRPEKP